MGTDTTSLEPLATLPQSLAGARIARDCAATLNAGFTSVRELAGYGVFVSRAINEGWIPGPNIYSSHSILSMTAGHGDLHSQPLSLLKDCQDHGMPMYLCDGVDECVKAVRRQIRDGAKVIKICATGGVLSLIDDPQHAEFSPAEIKAIVDEAARAHRIVAAHCHGKAGIMNALNSGVKTIEHGSYLDDEAIELVLKSNAILIATRTIVEFGISHLDDFNEPNRLKMREISSAHKRNYASAVKAGVRCALGTDLGFSNANIEHNHGMNGKEFGFAVRAGMTLLQAIEAGTANAPATLGPQAPKSGMLREGYDADFIALEQNPLEDIEILARPEKITHVWKGGKLCKAPGRPVGFAF
jgi:imidazolonepropionase-like amidohydrolase